METSAKASGGNTIAQGILEVKEDAKMEDDKMHEAITCLENAVTCLRECRNSRQPIPCEPKQITAKRYLIDNGFRTSLLGLNYLSTAVELYIPGEIGIIKLYEETADRFCTTASKVERAIRHLIEVFYKEKPDHPLNKGYAGRYSNKEMIAQIYYELERINRNA